MIGLFVVIGVVATVAGKGTTTSGTSNPPPAVAPPAAPTTSSAPAKSFEPAPPPSKPSPAQMLADLDHGKHPTADYQAALDAVKPKCQQDEAAIGRMGDAALKLLRQNSIQDEDELSVLQHLDQSLPPGVVPLDCSEILGAYVTLRGHG